MERPDLFVWLAVGSGGALGSAARFAVSAALARPWGTLTVNVLGCLAMGLCLGLDLGERAKAFLAIGLLGGFTTFSGLGADLWLGWQEGARASLGLYLVASLLLGVAAVVGGHALARVWAA